MERVHMLRAKSFYFIFIIAIALSLSLFETPVFAQGQASVIYIEGAPKIIKAGKTEREECKLDMPIDDGDHIITLKDEAVEISFLSDKSNVVRIEEDSDLFIKKKEAPYSLELITGSVMALIKKLPAKSSFKIATPTGVCGARGTGWRSSTAKERSRFEAFEHSIYVAGIGQSGNPLEGELIVKSGWGSALEKYGKPGKLYKLSYDDIERWNRWRKDLFERITKIKRSMNRAGNTQGTIGQLQSIKSDIQESKGANRLENQQDKGDSGSTGGTTSFTTGPS